MSEEKRINGSLLIGYDIIDEENCVLLVGKKTEKSDAEIINAFEGKEAYELYKKLITKNI
jgi:hypothetical protein